MTYNDTMDYRAGLTAMAVELKPSYLLTLAFNKSKPTSYSYGADRLHHFHARLDRTLLGPRWVKIPSDRRSHSLAIPQGRDCSGRTDSEYLTDFHFHTLLVPPPYPKMALSAPVLANLAGSIWNSLVPAGHVDIGYFPSEDTAAVMDYCSRLMAGSYSTSIGIAHYCVN